MQSSFLAEISSGSQIEYSIIINPTDSLRNKIIKIKNEIHLKYNESILLNTRPNIRLSKFFNWEKVEERLTDHLRVTAMAMPPFKVVLKDYGSFPSHTLFINVTSRIPLQMLMKGLKALKPLIKSSLGESIFVNEFYIPLAVKLSLPQYEKIWKDYRNRKFTGNFIADGMLLLRRRSGEKNYQIVERFEFMNLPVSGRQGELFIQ
jgi:2'-5' RNA ligase